MGLQHIRSQTGYPPGSRSSIWKVMLGNQVHSDVMFAYLNIWVLLHLPEKRPLNLCTGQVRGVDYSVVGVAAPPPQK